ncbi:MAG TPA: ABC transporter ATP-binding protein [Rectinemataceae bacterium]|nr:ABC transporter ATP-binding protein [Rectinemataceae bacterium]
MSAPDKPAQTQGKTRIGDPDVVLELKNLRKEFHVHRGKTIIKAVDGISFSLKRGEILGLVGESGCGKTTTGKLVMRLIKPTSGSIIVDGEDTTAESANSKESDFAYRRRVQMIFQDPYASMNPHFKIRDVLEEPLLIHGVGADKTERSSMIAEVMTKVKMVPVEEYLDRHPHMLSGGQRQRIATARTLILRPSIIVADEPVSMIDLSTRAEILQLMKTIQQEMALSFIYITHDISTARYFTDRIAVMYLGRIVEIGTQDEVIDNPKHPYTKALIQAVCEPVSGRVGKMRELDIKGEIPSAANIPSGCRFHPRCPYATKECAELPEPELIDVGDGHSHACRRWKEI